MWLPAPQMPWMEEHSGEGRSSCILAVPAAVGCTGAGHGGPADPGPPVDLRARACYQPPVLDSL